MKRKIILSLALILVLVGSFNFAPAPQVDAAKPQAFNAGLVLWPLEPTQNVQHGNSDRWRTVYEHYGGFTTGDINGSVDMFITTNFVQKDETGPFGGPFHASLDITTADGGTISLNIKGKIDGVKADFGPGVGVQILFASISGKFNSTGSTGSLAGKHVNGDLSYTIDLTGFPVIISEGTLQGTIH